MWVSFLFFPLFLSIAILTVKLVPRDFTKRIKSDHPNALPLAGRLVRSGVREINSPISGNFLPRNLKILECLVTNTPAAYEPAAGSCRIWSFKSCPRVRHLVTNSEPTFEAPDPAGVFVTKHSSSHPFEI